MTVVLPAPTWGRAVRKQQILTPAVCAELARDAGWRSWQCARIVAIVTAENGRDAMSISYVHKQPGDDNQEYHGSADVGLCAINTRAWKLSPADIAALLDPTKSLTMARNIFLSRGGDRDPVAGYRAWNVYEGKDAGAWLNHAQLGVDAAKAVGEL